MFKTHSIAELHRLNQDSYRFIDLNLCKKGDGLFDNYLDMVYIITMENSDRHEKMISELKKNKPYHKIKILYNKGFKNTNKVLPENGSNYDLVDANRHIFMDAMSNDYENILIFEDDVCFYENYTKQDIENIGNFIKTNNYDLYDIGPCGVSFCIPYIYDLNQYCVFFRTGSHSIIYNKCFIEKFFNETKLIHHIDMYTNHIKFKKFNYYNQICYQLFPKTENQKTWFIACKEIFYFDFLSKIVMDIIFYLITHFKVDSSPKYIPFIYNLNKLLGSTLVIITTLIILWIIYRIYKFLRFFYQYSINGKKD